MCHTWLSSSLFQSKFFFSLRAPHFLNFQSHLLLTSFGAGESGVLMCFEPRASRARAEPLTVRVDVECCTRTRSLYFARLDRFDDGKAKRRWRNDARLQALSRRACGGLVVWRHVDERCARRQRNIDRRCNEWPNTYELSLVFLFLICFFGGFVN